MMTILLFFILICPFLVESAGPNRYDKSISVFSPEGELLQVKYGEKASERGTPLVCSVLNDTVIILSPSLEQNNLLDRRLLDKCSRIDTDVWIALAGLSGDGRALVRLAREISSEYKSSIGDSPSAATIASAIGDVQHKTTLRGGERPFGVHAVVFGFDEKSSPSLYHVAVSGEVSRWTSLAIGSDALLLNDALDEAALRPEDGVRSRIDTLLQLMRRVLRRRREYEDDLSFDITLFTAEKALQAFNITGIAQLPADWDLSPPDVV